MNVMLGSVPVSSCAALYRERGRLRLGRSPTPQAAMITPSLPVAWADDFTPAPFRLVSGPNGKPMRGVRPARTREQYP